MMSFEQWKGRLAEVVRGIGDVDYQRRSWFGLGPEVSSPNEMICEVFDDYDLPGFILKHGSALSDSELQRAEDFVSALRSFADSTPAHLDPRVVFTDSRWEHVRSLATRMVEAWKK